MATAVVDEFQDRGVQFYELPEQIERKPGIFSADIFDDHRAQSVKFDDDLAASLIRRHETQVDEASKSLANGRPESDRAFLGRDRQVYGIFQMPVSGCLSYQQLGEFVGAQFSQGLDRDLALSRHGSIRGDRMWAGYDLYFFVIFGW